MASTTLPRGAEELSDEEVRWRVLKLKEILGITKPGPFMYTAASTQTERDVSYQKLPEEVRTLTRGPLFVHYHRGGILRVSHWAFEEFWGTGHYYCTVFDSSFSWFVFTDDNSEDSDRAVLLRPRERGAPDPR
jgi:hypothetical protein